MSDKKEFKYPGTRITTNGNQLIATYTQALIAEAGVFYPITPSTEMGENYQLCYAKGQLNAFGDSTVAIETEGEHAAQGGAIAISVTGKRVVNFTSGQGLVYGLEQYYHAPGKLSTMVLEVGARALTKHALNVHCGHDDIYAVMDTGWIMLFSKDAQQASDQSIILRRVTEMSLNPGINIQDGFLTTHLERTFLKPEPGLIREFLGASSDMIECPTPAQRELFGPKRRRVPEVINLKSPLQLGPVQNQEHYMNGIAARRNNFSEAIPGFFKQAFKDFGDLTGRYYDFISEYNCEDTETVFVSLGSSAENIEAVSDYLMESRGEKVGVIHINVLRPFPNNTLIRALKGKKNVIVLERTDESLSTENPLTQSVRVALSKGVNNWRVGAYENHEKIHPLEMPQIFSGVYGLGSRDFRPEGIIGAYDFCLGRIPRTDGKTRDDGVRFFYVGIDHPYSVVSDETPSCLPEKSIAIRFHSIGGWGMITTGKNLSEIIGDFSRYVAKRDDIFEEDGRTHKEIVHVSANPKYGSEKKGAPTNYFLVAAPERIRVNCDLKHVSVVLCCDPKIFLHSNPLIGLSEGGSFVWENAESTAEAAWRRIPKRYRREIIDKKIKFFTLDGFKIAENATKREDLQLRMQGNSFLGAFFKVSTFLDDYKIPNKEYLSTVRAQYEKKFGRFGEAVIESNMEVLQQGFERVRRVEHQDVDAPDFSSMCASTIIPIDLDKKEYEYSESEKSKDKKAKAPLFRMETFDKEFRAGLGYDQPATALASVGMNAAGSGSTASKYGARRKIPKWIEGNCTQCMECIVVCPDTALPNTAQDLSTVLRTSIRHYVTEESSRSALMKQVPALEKSIREDMSTAVAEKNTTLPFKDIAKARVAEVCKGSSSISAKAGEQLAGILDVVPMAYQKTIGIFKNREKKEAGSGGLFAIAVDDLCKGCSACVDACGDHQALVMVEEDDQSHAESLSATSFINRLPDTATKYLGLFKESTPEESKAATLRYHLMVQSKYKSFVAGDGACAGCGEKSVLRAIATLTETYMRPIFTRKSNRLQDKSDLLAKNGVRTLIKLEKEDPESYKALKRAILHLIMGYGGETIPDTEKRMEAFEGGNEEIIKGLMAVLRQDADNYKEPKYINGELMEGVSVMAMAANTGCNTVFGSTPPNNPHPYPWMNSLFQDGSTVGWLFAESFIQNHSRRSVIPERLTDVIVSKAGEFSEKDYFLYTHFTDLNMTDIEISELPKVWAVGGDGGMGDIGFQNLSKVMLQNRPNVKIMMLNTQVYSNTGGQNSDSSVMAGGFDMNQFGAASEGKLTELKSVAECFLGGHGSPYIAQVSMANTATLYSSILDGLSYRGTAYFQAFTSCQPEHGVPDDASSLQAQRIRDSRGIAEFIYDPQLGETMTECLIIKGNPNTKGDWYMKKIPGSKERYAYTAAHWSFTEARFRRHHTIVEKKDCEGLVRLEEQILNMTMDDIVYRRFMNPDHRAFVSTKGAWTIDYKDDGTPVYHIISRQMVLLCVERRKAWRILQDRAGVTNADYIAQKEHLAKLDEAK